MSATEELRLHSSARLAAAADDMLACALQVAEQQAAAPARPSQQEAATYRRSSFAALFADRRGTLSDVLNRRCLHAACLREHGTAQTERR